jgi:hypothetical protein
MGFRHSARQRKSGRPYNDHRYGIRARVLRFWSELIIIFSLLCLLQISGAHTKETLHRTDGRPHFVIRSPV